MMRVIAVWAIPLSVIAVGCGSIADTGYPCALDKTCPSPLQCSVDNVCVDGVAIPDGSTLQDGASADGGPDATVDASSDVTVKPDAPVDVIVVSDVTSDVPVTTSETGSVSVSITPGTIVVPGLKQTTLIATVTGATDKSVTWSIVETSDSGSVTSGGVYTAPGKNGEFHVVAKSVADPSRWATATVTVWYGSFTTLSSSLSVGRGLFASPPHSLSATDGRVLFLGGVTATGTSAAVDIYSATGVLAAGTSMTTARVLPGTVLLNDGSVLVVGGYTTNTLTSPVATMEAWSGSAWTAKSTSLAVARAKSPLVRGTDGRVFVMGGEISNASNSNAIDVIDPAQGFSVTSAGLLGLSRSGHFGVALDDGRILVAGGSNGGTITASTEIFKPSTTGAGTTSSGTSLSSGHYRGGVARLPNATLLFAGGCTGTGSSGCATGSTASELYAQATNQPGTVSATGAMSAGSIGHAMILLPTGRVLVAGGLDGSNALNRAEVYDPATGTWSTMGPLAFARCDATIGLTVDGKVIIAGGRVGQQAGSTVLASVELFDPGKPKMCRVCQFDGSCVTIKDGTPCDDDNTATSGEKCGGGVCAP